MPEAAAAGSFTAIACSARPTRDDDEVRREEERDADEHPDDRGVSCTGDLVACDDEPLRDSDAVLPAGEAVLRVQERPGDQGERERGEREVVAAQAHQRDADHHRDPRGDEWCDRDGEQGIDACLRVDEPRVRVEPHRQQPGGVGADQEEPSLAERDLAREPHEQGEADRDECIQAHPVVKPDVAQLELEGEPAREDGRANESGDARSAHAPSASCPALGCELRAHTASSPRERQPMSTSMIRSAMMRLYWESTYPTTSCCRTPSA